MPRSTAAERRRAAPCPKCGAQPHERCRKWVSEVCHHGHGEIFDGGGRWEYLKTFHPERKPS